MTDRFSGVLALLRWRIATHAVRVSRIEERVRLRCDSGLCTQIALMLGYVSSAPPTAAKGFPTAIDDVPVPLS